MIAGRDGNASTHIYEKILIDTDPGIDDAIALMIALASRSLRLLGLTVAAGNCSVDQGVRNALAITELMGRNDVKVFRGFSESLVRGIPRGGREIHGVSGLGHARVPAPTHPVSPETAVDGLIRMITQSPGEVAILAIAPLTNIASALQSCPDIGRMVRRIVIMGGAVQARGNVTAFAECNFYNDPEAAQIVLSSGSPITLVPLDVTRRAIIAEDEAEEVWGKYRDGAVANFFRDATKSYFKLREDTGSSRTAVMHDPLALMAFLEPGLLRIRPARVRVELHDSQHVGQLVEDRDGSSGSMIDVACSLDEGLFRKVFGERLRSAAALVAGLDRE